MQIEITQEDITKIQVEAIVNPANSHITMGGGLALKIHEAAGFKVKEEAKQYVPVKVGEAVVTSAGNLPCKYVIHAPTMNQPIEKVSVENTKSAMKAILECAEKNNIKEIAVPGLGTGVGGVPHKEAAEVMVNEARNFKSKKINKIIFVCHSEESCSAFKEATRRRKV